MSAIAPKAPGMRLRPKASSSSMKIMHGAARRERAAVLHRNGIGLRGPLPLNRLPFEEAVRAGTMQRRLR